MQQRDQHHAMPFVMFDDEFRCQLCDGRNQRAQVNDMGLRWVTNRQPCRCQRFTRKTTRYVREVEHLLDERAFHHILDRSVLFAVGQQSIRDYEIKLPWVIVFAEITMQAFYPQGRIDAVGIGAGIVFHASIAKFLAHLGRHGSDQL